MLHTAHTISQNNIACASDKPRKQSHSQHIAWVCDACCTLQIAWLFVPLTASVSRVFSLSLVSRPTSCHVTSGFSSNTQDLQCMHIGAAGTIKHQAATMQCPTRHLPAAVMSSCSCLLSLPTGTTRYSQLKSTTHCRLSHKAKSTHSHCLLLTSHRLHPLHSPCGSVLVPQEQDDALEGAWLHAAMAMWQKHNTAIVRSP